MYGPTLLYSQPNGTFILFVKETKLACLICMFIAVLFHTFFFGFFVFNFFIFQSKTFDKRLSFENNYGLNLILQECSFKIFSCSSILDQVYNYIKGTRVA